MTRLFCRSSGNHQHLIEHRHLINLRRLSVLRHLISLRNLINDRFRFYFHTMTLTAHLVLDVTLSEESPSAFCLRCPRVRRRLAVWKTNNAGAFKKIVNNICVLSKKELVPKALLIHRIPHTYSNIAKPIRWQTYDCPKVFPTRNRVVTNAVHSLERELSMSCWLSHSVRLSFSAVVKVRTSTHQIQTAAIGKTQHSYNLKRCARKRMWAI